MTKQNWGDMSRAERRRTVKASLKQHQYRQTGFSAREFWLRSALPSVQ